MSSDNLKGWHKRGYLPHLDCDEVIQFITFRLNDSIPKDVITQWRDELAITDLTSRNAKEYQKLQEMISKFEDSGYGECLLQDQQVYKIVKEAFEYYDGIRYDLLKLVIMPNHVHLLVKQKPGFSLSKIIHSWKSFTANEANKYLNREGTLWMADYYDTYIRDDEHLEAVIKYIDKNIAMLEKIQKKTS